MKSQVGFFKPDKWPDPWNNRTTALRRCPK